jgi:hypothetical protein
MPTRRIAINRLGEVLYALIRSGASSATASISARRYEKVFNMYMTVTLPESRLFQTTYPLSLSQIKSSCT